MTITATYENGVFRPDVPLDLPAKSRVQLQVDSISANASAQVEAWEEFEQLADTSPVSLNGKRFNRDDFYDRN